MSASLHTLLAHTERLRDESRLALQQAEDAEAALRRQAEQLQHYQAEYDQRHPARHGRAASIELLRCHVGFMQRLQQAQQLQQGQLRAAQARCEQQRQALLALELRTAAVRKLLDRREQQAQQAGERLDQRRTDEAAQRVHRRQAAAAAAAR